MLIHKREKPYMCKDCNKSFGYLGIFNKHMKSHTQYSPYTKCQQCDKCFLNSITLKKHMSVHNKPLEGVDFLSSLPSELLSLLVCYCDLGTAVSLGQRNISLLQVITHPRVWGKVMKRSRMDRMEEEEVLLLMDQMLELLDLSLDPDLLLSSLRSRTSSSSILSILLLFRTFPQTLEQCHSWSGSQLSAAGCVH